MYNKVASSQEIMNEMCSKQESPLVENFVTVKVIHRIVKSNVNNSKQPFTARKMADSVRSRGYSMTTSVADFKKEYIKADRKGDGFID